MARFQTVRRRARFVVHGFSQDAMLRIAEPTRESIRARIQDRGETVYDAPARPLKAKYAKMKNNYTRKYGSPKAKQIRNWTLTGHTMDCMRVIWVAVNRASISFLAAVNSLRPAKLKLPASVIAHIQNMRERQFGLSPRDKQVLAGAVHKEARRFVKAEKVA